MTGYICTQAVHLLTEMTLATTTLPLIKFFAVTTEKAIADDASS